ncbi:alpha/beta fold hydrolase [Variovorax sp. KK3]|uniref:alpha/beta fold hydrolase n=1 Tax=Variovorax sp. KK3 TaxID=1855728 RepID=UPI00097C8A48|nr:alpha/beta hydrolase [Variovorax sp. KK3]
MTITPERDAPPPFQPTHRRPYIVTKDGTRLHYGEFGEGPPLLFVASWALHGQMWEYQVAHFAERGYRCVFFDRRGHGKSDVPPGGYDLDTLADDLQAVIEGLDLRDVVIVAHSMGAAETIRHAARHACKRIRKIVMLGPVAPCLLLKDDNAFGAPRAFFDETLSRYAADFPQWAYEMQEGFFNASTSAPLKEHFTRQLLDIAPIVAIKCFRALVDADLREDLAAVDRPVLILHGALDVQAPLAITGERLAAGLPHVTLEVYDDAPHGIWITHLQRVNRDIGDFLGREAV